MIAIDAGVLIAALSRLDPHHEASLSVLSAADEFVAHAINLAEALVGSTRIGRLDQALARFATYGVVEAGRSQNEAILLASLRAATGLKLPHCCALLTAESHDGVLATFDRRLARAAEHRGLEVLGI